MRLSKFITQKVRMANWHLSLLKYSALLFGVCVGVIFNEVLDELILPIFIASVVLGLGASCAWCRAMKKACKKEEECIDPDIIF